MPHSQTGHLWNNYNLLNHLHQHSVEMYDDV